MGRSSVPNYHGALDTHTLKGGWVTTFPPAGEYLGLHAPGKAISLAHDLVDLYDFIPAGYI